MRPRRLIHPPIVPVVAAVAAASAYLDAKYHISHDIRNGVLTNPATTALQYMAELEKKDRLLVYHLIEDHARQRPDALFLEFEGRSWTYGAFYADLQRVGNWLMNDLGIQKGEMVAIDGPNSPEYLMLWFALDGIGAMYSYINCNLTGPPLVHCVKLCGCRYLIAEREVKNLIHPCDGELGEAGVKAVYYDEHSIAALSDRTPIPKERGTGLNATDVRNLVYTSGTTGNPKGVMLSTGRLANTARSMATYLKLQPTDKFYTCLPLYHAAAQGLCVTPTIFAGGSLRLGRKFSHKTFWNEVSESGATRLQYVGELCRYLVNAEPHPMERKHVLQSAWGNGMRPDVWEVFRTRFNIPEIHELYAGTDGMGPTFNRNRGDFTRSAIGLRGLLWHLTRDKYEVRAKIDPDTEELVRGSDGFVVKAGVNEPGEVLHRVDPEMKLSAFRGYFGNDEATAKRWMTDVFERGDLFFRSGDLMRVDADGRVYFVDRLGDTFRWRSENVSTNEVADTLGSFDQIAECSVYGVSVPRSDGRCGCATVVPTAGVTVDAFEFARLADHLRTKLPRYAVPLFLRMAPELQYTGTFKIQKGTAKKEGIDVDLIEASGSKDRVYWLPPDAKAYVPYQRSDWEALKSGHVKL
nr:fatty acid transporter protein [Quercus suber]